MYVLDTNVVSHLRRPDKADPNVVAWASSTPVTLHFMSSITLHELERGILSMEHKDAAQGAILRAWMNGQILTRFSGRILPVDIAVAQRCAKLHVPDPKPERDAFIAATALVHGMTVVTRNVDDFKLTGVEVLNPWEWQPDSVTLHAEMEEILRDRRNKWTTPAKIASEVNSRSRYRRDDGADVTGSQITARAKQYEQVFECRSERSGLQIRLRRGP
jgi:predicted nucleic acid-binding protein